MLTSSLHSPDEAPLRAMERMADMYGPIYQLKIGKETRFMVSSAEMMKEIMDEKRFMKFGVTPLMEPGRPNGVIVAPTLDPDWEQGHRILRPVGSLGMAQQMYGVDTAVV